MKNLILGALITAMGLLAEATPKPISTEDKFELAKSQLQVVDSQRRLAELTNQYLQLQELLRKQNEDLNNKIVKLMLDQKLDPSKYVLNEQFVFVPRSTATK